MKYLSYPFQNLVIECIVSEQVGNGICGRKHENCLLITPYHFWLVAVLFVVRSTFCIEFTQIVLVKFNNHIFPFLCAKLPFLQIFANYRTLYLHSGATIWISPIAKHLHLVMDFFCFFYNRNELLSINPK